MLEELREQVHAIACLAEEQGLCRPGGGNFSQIDRARGLVVITPHAHARGGAGAEELLVMDLQGGVVENRGGLRPSSEAPMHLMIYAGRADIAAVCHTHAPNAAVFACLGLPVKPVLYEAMMYGGVCRVTPFADPGTDALGRSAVAGLEGSWATILGKHGLVTVGESVRDAYLKTVYVEEVCGVNLRAAAVVGYDKLEGLSDAQIARFRENLGMRA